MKISSYTEKYREHVIDLLSSNNLEVRKIRAALWDWQYVNTPYVKRVEDTGVVITEAGSVVGFNGFMPVRLKYNGQLIEAAWSCETIISQAFRGKGYGVPLVDAVKIRFPLVLGLGISDTAAHLLKKRGYKVCLEIDSFSYTNSIFGLKDIARLGIQYLTIIKNITTRPSTAGLTAKILDIAYLSPQTDLLWQTVSHGYSKSIVRDYAYLYWKYASHPFLKYHMIVIERRQAIVALAIFLKRDDGVSRLVDYIGPSRDIRIKYLIIRTFQQACSRSKLASCISTDAEIKLALTLRGFRRQASKPRFYIYSNIESDQKIENNWFVMGGDSDGGIRG